MPLHRLAALVVDPPLLLFAGDAVVAVVTAIVPPVAAVVTTIVACLVAVVPAIVALVGGAAILLGALAGHAFVVVAALPVGTAISLLLALPLLVGQSAFVGFALPGLLATLLHDAPLHVFALLGLALHACFALAGLHVQVLAALLFALAAALVPVLAALGLPAAIALLQGRAWLVGLALLHLRGLPLLALRFLPLWLFATRLLAVDLLLALLAAVAILVLVLLKRERGGSSANGEQCGHQRNGQSARGEMAGHDLLHLMLLHRPRTIRAVRAVSGVKDESILRFSLWEVRERGLASSYSASAGVWLDGSVYGVAGFSRRVQTLLAIFHSPSTLSSTK
ncbi:MAG TPA: hypothetical protein PK861_08130 [Thermomonas sp.]|nr:hypothetical protein [Thermomonas sp.]